MRIVFVRHGEPDYARDCLTEEGARQAAARCIQNVFPILDSFRPGYTPRR